MTNSSVFPSFARLSLWMLALTLTVSFGSKLSATETEDKGAFIAPVPIPSGLSGSDVQKAIVSAFVGREWAVKSKADGVVVGYLKHRGNEATVTMTYDGTRIEIYSIGYKIDKTTGSRIKPEQPAGWLKNLQSDLPKFLSRAASTKQ